MAKLLFFETDHRYEVDGINYPSVSEICRFISKEIYGDVMQFNLDRAAERGSKVHKAIENIIQFGECEIDDSYAPYVAAFMQWYKDRKVKKTDILGIEKSYAHTELQYAGTMDLVARLNGKVTLIDYKTSSAAQKKLWTATENGYVGLWNSNNPQTPIEQIIILHLKNDGTCKEIELPIDGATFMACYTLHELLKTKPRKKKGEQNV